MHACKIAALRGRLHGSTPPSNLHGPGRRPSITVQGARRQLCLHLARMHGVLRPLPSLACMTVTLPPLTCMRA